MVLPLWILLSIVFRVCLCHTVSSVICNLVVTCWERADLLALLCVVFFLCFCHFPMRCLGSGVVLDCIDSLFLNSSLHCRTHIIENHRFTGLTTRSEHLLTDVT